MFLQFGDEVAGEGSLTLGSDGPNRREVVFGIRQILVVVGGLDDLHHLVGEVGGQSVKRLREHREPLVPEGIV